VPIEARYLVKRKGGRKMKIKVSAAYIIEQYKDLEFKKEVIDKVLAKKESEDLPPEILGAYYLDLDLIEMQKTYLEALSLETDSNQ
jgi:hypothetical protein